MRTRKSPADRLILIIAKHRGAATVRQIVRSHLTGAAMEQAKRETAGLVVFEPTYRNGSHKRSQTARLTQIGVWRAIQLIPEYNPSLVLAVLAAIDIKALLNRLEAERNPLAIELAGYRADALEFRRQLAARKAAKTKEEKNAFAKPKRKRNARHYERLNQFLEAREKPLAKVPPVAAPPTTTPVKSHSGWRDTVSPLPQQPTQIPPMQGKHIPYSDADLKMLGMKPNEACVICENGEYDWRKGECPPHNCLENARLKRTE